MSFLRLLGQMIREMPGFYLDKLEQLTRDLEHFTKGRP